MEKKVKSKSGIDYFVAIPSVLIVIAFAAAIFFNKDGMNSFLTDVFWYVNNNFGWVFLVFFFVCLLTCGWLIFGKYANCRFGDEAPERSTFSFYALLFVGASSASIIYWVFIEFFYYLQTPPFGAEQFSLEALRWGSTYGSYHWGMVPFSSYAVAGVAFAFMFFVKKTKSSRISTACAGLIGEKHANGAVGKVIDSFFLISIIISTAGYSLGVSVPLVATFLEESTGVAHTFATEIWVLVAMTVLVIATMYTGLNKGMTYVSNARLILCFGLLIYVFLVGPTSFMINNAVESIGTQLTHFIEMSLYTDAIGGSGWPQSWTMYNATMFIAAIVSCGLYYGRLCKGRTVKESVIGMLVASALGCMVFFWVLSNYSISVYLGDPEAFKAMMAIDPYKAIGYAVGQLPFAGAVMIVILVYAFVSMWTFAQSIVYTMAMVAQPNLSGNEEPSKFNRVFWCIITCVLTAAFLSIGGLQTVKNSLIWAAVPALIIILMVIFGNFREMKYEWGDAVRGESKKGASAASPEGVYAAK